MTRPIPLTAADAANEALLVIEREYPDLDTRREAVEQVVRVMRSSVLPRLETTDFASKPKW